MDCRKCKATFEPGDASGLTQWQASVAILKDWKMWALAFVITLTVCFLGEGVGLLPGGWGAGIGGGLIGLIGVYRMRGLRKCPKCGATVRI
jgi:hypothetical protein